MKYEVDYSDNIYEPDYLLDSNGNYVNRPYFIHVVCDNKCFEVGNSFQIGINCIVSRNSSDQSDPFLKSSCNTQDIENIFWNRFIEFQGNDKLTYLGYHIRRFVKRRGKTENFLILVKFSFDTFKASREYWKEGITDDIIKANKKVLTQWIKDTRNTYPIVPFANKENQVKTEPEGHSIKKSKLKSEIKPENFDDLFNDEKEAERSIQILRKVQPPILNEKGHYNLGKHQKGVITAWVKVLRDNGNMRTIKDADTALLLNNKIIGLNLGLDGRTLRNLKTTAYNKYYNQILKLIN